MSSTRRPTSRGRGRNSATSRSCRSRKGCGGPSRRTERPRRGRQSVRNLERSGALLDEGAMKRAQGGLPVVSSYRLRRALQLALVAAVVVAFGPGSAVRGDETTRARTGHTQLTERQKAAHVLSRLTFGARPGEVDRVAALGWKAWVEKQLHPEKIDDSACERRLAGFKSLHMTNREIIDTFRQKPRDDSQAEKRRVNQLKQQPARELVQATLIRALYSERQLFEVMCNFWRNHFNVDVSKNACRFFTVNYEQDVIRKHVFGRFEDMLLASAKHPAMLVYLDNVLSQRPLSEDEKKLLAQPGADKNRRLQRLARERGLNENYARELLELHTLGVDNGYTQRDVRELARVLTGWTVDAGPRGSFGFRFRAGVHDQGAKRVLGMVVGGRSRIRGVAEGEVIIRKLARDPRTAHFIARKLCVYLVTDNPPEDLVERIAGVFLDTKGDLREVTRAIILDPAFFDPRYVGTKFRTPFEFTVAALRATGAEVRKPKRVLQALKIMRQPIYQCADPTGYYDTREAWLDPGVLALRWQLALDLVGRGRAAIRIDWRAFARGADEDRPLSVQLVHRLMPFGVGERTFRVLRETERRMQGMPRRAVVQRLVALLIGSPEFQRQ
ncbi:MAG: DUF1800 domain-containing protein [Planctomycetota bacterium]|nr:MAG: DUF1800 domain-containing protein [Planctomycetota bacterium]